jgi:hypothetical protein
MLDGCLVVRVQVLMEITLIIGVPRQNFNKIND